MARLSQLTEKFMIPLIGGACGLLALGYPDWRSDVHAQSYDCANGLPCQIFDERAAFFTGAVTSASQAREFGSTTKQVSFDERLERAFISATREALSPIVIDNFLVVNGECSQRPQPTVREEANRNVCAERPGLSCFNDIDKNHLIGDVDRDATDIAIGEILTATDRAIEVETFIPSGTNSFTLCDFGSIAGNIELFLVITPRCSERRDVCEGRVADNFNAEVGESGTGEDGQCLQTAESNCPFVGATEPGPGEEPQRDQSCVSEQLRICVQADFLETGLQECSLCPVR